MQALAIHGLASHLADPGHAAIGSDDDDEAVLGRGGEARVIVGRQEDVALDVRDLQRAAAWPGSCGETVSMGTVVPQRGKETGMEAIDPNPVSAEASAVSSP